MNLYIIYGAKSPGTSFYEVTKDDVLDIFESENVNIILRKAFELYGWDIFDFSYLYGTKLIDDILYICSTDGTYIEVDGELVNPEVALDDFDLEDLDVYIKEPTPEIIKHNLSSYELSQIQIDPVIDELREDGYSYDKIYNAISDLKI